MMMGCLCYLCFFFFQAEDGIRDYKVTGVQTCALPIYGFALSFPPPAIPGVGTSGGFTFVLEDRSGKDVQFLADNLNKFMAAAQKRKEIAGMVSTFLPAVPQQFVDVDREKALKQGVPLSEVYRTIQAYMG